MFSLFLALQLRWTDLLLVYSLGRRMHWVTATGSFPFSEFRFFGSLTNFRSRTAALWVLTYALLAYTNVNPLVPSILGSLALATNVLPWIVS